MRTLSSALFGALLAAAGLAFAQSPSSGSSGASGGGSATPQTIPQPTGSRNVDCDQPGANVGAETSSASGSSNVKCGSSASGQSSGGGKDSGAASGSSAPDSKSGTPPTPANRNKAGE